MFSHKFLRAFSFEFNFKWWSKATCFPWVCCFGTHWAHSMNHFHQKMLFLSVLCLRIRAHEQVSKIQILTDILGTVLKLVLQLTFSKSHMVGFHLIYLLALTTKKHATPFKIKKVSVVPGQWQIS